MAVHFPVPGRHVHGHEQCTGIIPLPVGPRCPKG